MARTVLTAARGKATTTLVEIQTQLQLCQRLAPADPERSVHACRKTARFCAQVGRGYNSAHRHTNSHCRASICMIFAPRKTAGNQHRTGLRASRPGALPPPLSSKARRRGRDRAAAAAAGASPLSAPPYPARQPRCAPRLTASDPLRLPRRPTRRGASIRAPRRKKPRSQEDRDRGKKPSVLRHEEDVSSV